MSKKIIALLTALLLIVSLSACAKTGQTSDNEQNVTTLPVTTEPETEPVTRKEADKRAAYIYDMYPDFTPVNYDSPALLPESEPADESYLNDTVFLCDSPLYWLGPEGFVDMTQIWTGPEGTQTLAYQSSYEILDRYDNVERPIRDVVEIHKPARMIITMGINGLGFMSEEEFKAEYKDLVEDIQELSPETDLILQSILPMSPAMFKWSTADVDNVKITRANSLILEVAEETGCKYLDTFSVLIGENGYGIDSLLKDGLHPNTEGLQLVVDYINTHAHTDDPEFG